MTRYEILLGIIDQIRKEGSQLGFVKYCPGEHEIEQINNARAKAFIHLFLKVSFGLLDFKEREHFITDAAYDGGIDGYFINPDNKTIYFIQSKFRTTVRNFEKKKIELSEILVMDINRILDGDKVDEAGIHYNGKIYQMQREISQLENIARYSYRVILLANLDKISDTKIRQLTGGYSTEIFDYEKCYNKLLFPVIAGTFFNASDLNINIDLSNKNAGTKISYTVQTKKGDCEITVLFVPTLEIGRIMHKYKNSILKYNPRSYLDFDGKKVNNAIRDTILNVNTNEFALFNNGITMLSDETFLNEKIGQKNKAQVTVLNPQIINGGQTSFTLSRIYQEHLDQDLETVFQNKEVLLKIITLLDKNESVNKVELIEEISTATNQQTPVIGADRVSNDKIHLIFQEILFNRYGLFYERKRGEFSDGVFEGYIKQAQILERNLFFRIYYAANGSVSKSRQKKLFLNQKFTEEMLEETEKLDSFYFGFLFFTRLYKDKRPYQVVDAATFAKVFAFTTLYKPTAMENYEIIINSYFDGFNTNWRSFYQKGSGEYKKLRLQHIEKTQSKIPRKLKGNWIDSSNFVEAVKNKFEIIEETGNSSPVPAGSLAEDPA